MSTLAQTPTSDVRRLLEFAETLEASAPDLRTAMDRERRLPEWLAAEMGAAGLFHMLTPRALGGLELDPLTAASVVERLARVEGSVGWCAMIASQSAWFLAFLESDAAREIAGATDSAIAGALKPGGRARRAPGGYRVSGRWPFASGCTHATWLYGSCLVEAEDAASASTPEIRVVYVPASEARIEDTWYSNGLRGTGSHDFVLDDAYVPESRTLPFPVFGPAHGPGPAYRGPIINLIFVLQAAHALGMARAAFDAFRALAPAKRRWSATAVLRDEPSVRAHVAEAHAQVCSARAWLFEVAGRVWDTLVAGDLPTMAERMDLRMAITRGISQAVEAASTLDRIAGSDTVYESHPLNRIARDLHTAAAHVQASPGPFERAGGYLLGDESPVSPGLV